MAETAYRTWAEINFDGKLLYTLQVLTNGSDHWDMFYGNPYYKGTCLLVAFRGLLSFEP